MRHCSSVSIHHFHISLCWRRTGTKWGRKKWGRSPIFRSLYISPPSDNYYAATKWRNYHSSLFNPSIFLKCSSRETKVSPCSTARAAIQISFSGIGCPFLCKESLIRPYSLLVPISDARTVLAMAKFSIRAVFSFGRPDLKAPKKSFPNNCGRWTG